jgi:hypothetical protein
VDAREEVSSGLFVAGCDGAKVLDDVEETFDEVALAIERKVALARRLAICPRRNDGLDAADFGKRLTHYTVAKTELQNVKHSPIATGTQLGASGL